MGRKITFDFKAPYIGPEEYLYFYHKSYFPPNTDILNYKNDGAI